MMEQIFWTNERKANSLIEAMVTHIADKKRKRKRALNNKTVKLNYNDETRGIEIHNLELLLDELTEHWSLYLKD